MNSPSEHVQITERRGFLPDADPLVSFDLERYDERTATYLRQLEEIGEDLPAILDEGELRAAVDSLPEMPAGVVADLDGPECWRLCLLSGFLASAYVHSIGRDTVDSIPASIAVPLYECSQRFKRKPILAYDLLCLRNFRRIEPAKGFQVENIETLLDFTTHDDERWFVAIHIAIEAAAGPGLDAAIGLQDAIVADDTDQVQASLETIQESVSKQTHIMKRMDERNDPEVFATEFRPYYKGFDDVVYEGVEAFDGEPQSFRGGSGAQSLALPSLDAALGIDHSGTGLTGHLDALRSYLPEDHRAVVTAFETGPDVRSYIQESGAEELFEAYNECVEAVAAFRTVHFGQTMSYIRRMTDDSAGTGGTDYESFLRTLKMETESHQLDVAEESL
jgi:indoleamine 2,3-dioxygenase